MQGFFYAIAVQNEADAVPNRDDGVLNRDDGVPNRDDGVPNQDDGVLNRDEGVQNQADAVLNREDLVQDRKIVVLEIQVEQKGDYCGPKSGDFREVGKISNLFLGSFLCIASNISEFQEVIIFLHKPFQVLLYLNLSYYCML